MAKNFSRHGDDLVTRRYRALIDWRLKGDEECWVRAGYELGTSRRRVHRQAARVDGKISM